MKTEKNILIAFLLNVSFSLFEFIGGNITGSIAIISDAVHDLGDSISIGISYFLEKKSKKKPDNKYTYGYLRYSVLGGLITTLILVIGSLIVIYNVILRFKNPKVIDYNGMIIFAIFGVIINFLAAYFTHEGDSINQKAVNLHMLEDVLGWVVVLLGSIIIKFTDITMIDNIMSILVAVFILINALKNLKSVLDLFLEKIPKEISLEEIEEELLKIKDVKNVHHIHVWALNENNIYVTLHAKVTNIKTKKEIKHKLEELGIVHSTVELDFDEECDDKDCKINNLKIEHHH